MWVRKAEPDEEALSTYMREVEAYQISDTARMRCFGLLTVDSISGVGSILLVPSKMELAA